MLSQITYSSQTILLPAQAQEQLKAFVIIESAAAELELKAWKVVVEGHLRCSATLIAMVVASTKVAVIELVEVVVAVAAAIAAGTEVIVMAKH